MTSALEAASSSVQSWLGDSKEVSQYVSTECLKEEATSLLIYNVLFAQKPAGYKCSSQLRVWGKGQCVATSTPQCLHTR